MKNIMLIAVKESFLVRVLIKKLNENKFNAFFVPCRINAIELNFDKADTIVYYLDNSEHFQSDIVHYLTNKLISANKKIAFVGEKNDAEDIHEMMPDHLIWQTFIRPLDTNVFIDELKEHFQYTEFAESVSEGMKTILIVDDDPTYIGVIRMWLKNRYKVGMANSGAQALQWLGVNPASDLILLDFEMPVMPGPKVLEMLWSDPDTSGIPVFFLTSKNDKDSVMQVMSMHPENYLLKSIEQKELLQKLDSFFLMNGR